MYCYLFPSSGLKFILMFEIFSDKFPKFVYCTTAPSMHIRKVIPRKHIITMNPGLN